MQVLVQKPIHLLHHIYMRKVEWENMQRVAIMLVATAGLNTKEIKKNLQQITSKLVWLFVQS